MIIIHLWSRNNLKIHKTIESVRSDYVTRAHIVLELCLASSPVAI